MIIAKQSTARTIMVGPVLDADGVAVTGGVVGDFKISKNGAAPGALDGSATLTHRHTGFYSLALTANDLDTVGSAQVTIDDTVNACPMAQVTVIEEAIYDALFAASATGLLPANVTQWNSSAVATPTVAGVPEVDVTHYGGSAGTFASGRPEVNTTHAAGTAWGSGAITAASIAADAITAAKIATGAIDADALAADAAAEIADAVWDEDATAHQTQGTFGQAIGDPGADSDSIWAITNAIGSTGTGLSAIPWNAAWDAEVQSEVEDGLVTHRLDELLNADSDIDGAAPPTVGSVFHELMSKTTGSFTFDQTTDSLEAVRDNTGTAGAGLTNIGTIATVTNLTNLPAITSNWLTAAGLATDAVNEIADAIWDEATSGHVTAGTFGKAVADTLALATGNDVYLSDITLRIPAALTAGGNMKADLDTIKTQTVTCAGGVTIPAATLASTTNITGGTITTVTTTTNLTNAPTAGDFTSTMKTSIETAVQNFMEGVAVTDFTSIPVSTPTYSEALGFIYALGLNKHTCTATTATIYDSDNNAVGTATVSDDGSTFQRTRYS